VEDGVKCIVYVPSSAEMNEDRDILMLNGSECSSTFATSMSGHYRKYASFGGDICEASLQLS
jgi:hypothetical protein